ncbi:MAG: phenylacetic acid degradation PaaB family protein [Gemmatimonadota bacterium]
MVYEVFARKSRGDVLKHVGNVTAPDDELAKVYAFSTYDEEKWFDMFIAPRDRWVEVFNRYEPASELGIAAAKPRKAAR